MSIQSVYAQWILMFMMSDRKQTNIQTHVEALQITLLYSELFVYHCQDKFSRKRNWGKGQKLQHQIDYRSFPLKV